MPSAYLNILTSFIAGTLCSAVLLPVILKIAVKRKLYDKPDSRKNHRGNVPRLGGMAFLPSLMLGMLCSLGFDLLLGCKDAVAVYAGDVQQITFCFIALCLIYGSGVADDLFRLRYRTKFMIQIICGVLLICGGLCIDTFGGTAGIGTLPGYVSWPFTVLMTVFIVNAFNLIDGIDGLCTMLTQLAMLSYGIIFICAGDIFGATICAATLGTTLPFLRYNIAGNPARCGKLFMGDTGSMTLGLICAALGMRVLATDTSAALAGTSPVILALAPLLIPCFDTVRVYFVRLRAHKSPFLPDRNHIHHRLLDMGMKPHSALAALVTASALTIAADALLSACLDLNIVLAADVAVWIAATSLIRRCGKR